MYSLNRVTPTDVAPYNFFPEHQCTVVQVSGASGAGLVGVTGQFYAACGVVFAGFQTDSRKSGRSATIRFEDVIMLLPVLQYWILIRYWNSVLHCYQYINIVFMQGCMKILFSYTLGLRVYVFIIILKKKKHLDFFKNYFLIKILKF